MTSLRRRQTTLPFQIPSAHGVARERLAGLMLFRILVATLFLGANLVYTATTLADLSQPRNLGLVALIVATYAVTIAYALAYERWKNLKAQAYLQFGVDILLTTAITALTGGLESVFVLLYFVVIISAAVVAGQRAAMASAFATIGAMVGLSMVVLWAPALLTPFYPLAPLHVSGKWILDIAINGGSAVLVGALAGYLARRLGETTMALEKQRLDNRELRQLNDHIIASMPSGLLAAAPNGAVIFCNQAAQQILDLTENAILGRPLVELFPMPEVEDALGRLAKTPPKLTLKAPDPVIQGTYPRPDGRSSFLGLSLSPLSSNPLWGAGEGLIVVFDDLTQLHQLQQRIQHSERLAAVGRLSAAIAHEIRNPLASISGSVEILQSSTSVSGEDAALMDIVVREVQRLNGLLTDFLNYSRPRQLHPEPSDPVALVQEIVRLYSGSEAGPEGDVDRVQIEVLDHHAPTEVVVDREAFQQIVWNLLHNARDAARCAQSPRIRLELQGTEGQDRWQLAVEDSGPGVPDDVRPNLFNPFFTTKPQGTGLGLATVYRLIEEHGGQISLVPSRELGGARFEIELPFEATVL